MIHPTKIAELQRIIADARAADPDDDQLLTDMLDGADWDEILTRCFLRRRECLANKRAMEDLASQYKARAGMFDAQAERIGKLLGKLAALYGKNIKHPLGGVVPYETDVWEVAEDASVDDVPEAYVRVTRTLDKNAMKKDAAEGKNIPGVRKVRKRVTQIRG